MAGGCPIWTGVAAGRLQVGGAAVRAIPVDLTVP
jgi:hypothetical protein